MDKLWWQKNTKFDNFFCWHNINFDKTLTARSNYYRTHIISKLKLWEKTQIVTAQIMAYHKLKQNYIFDQAQIVTKLQMLQNTDYDETQFVKKNINHDKTKIVT